MRNKKLKSVLMLPVVIVTVVFLGFFTESCKRGVLVSPDNTTLLVTVNPSKIPVGGTATVRVLASKESGTPVADDTVIYFSTDMGSIESNKGTRNGIAEAVFTSNDNKSGIANIVVSSGNAKMSPDSVKIMIGSAALKTLTLSGYPSSLPRGGGDATIKVKALDENGNSLSNISVLLSTTSGTLRSNGSFLITDSNGSAEDLLSTQTSAEITAISGSIKSDILKVNIEANTAPLPLFESSPSAPRTGDTVYFNASKSTDPDGSITSYSWDFGDGEHASGQTTTHVYTRNASFKVTLEVTDNTGLKASTSGEIKVIANSKPTAKFYYSPFKPTIKDMVQFNASESEDSDGTIVKYEWNFGDSTSNASGKIVSHEYSAPGTYKVRLNVTDDSGGIGIAEESVLVEIHKSPTAEIKFSPDDPRLIDTVYFSGSNSRDADGYITEYSWNFGDGVTASGENTSHKYSQIGFYRVVLTVTDNDNNTGFAVEDVKVTLGQAPKALFTFTPSSPVVNYDVTFNATTSSDPDGSIVSYVWDFGDGYTGVGTIAKHKYSSKGSYTVILTVKDNDNNETSSSQALTVN